MSLLEILSCKPSIFLTEIQKAYKISQKFGFMLDLVNPKISDLHETCPELHNIMDSLHDLNKSGNLTQVVLQLPEYEMADVVDESLARELHVIYSIIANCYLWCNGEIASPKVIPRQIAVPLNKLSRKTGLLPMVCHADLVLTNVGISDMTQPFCLNNLEMKYSFTGYNYNQDWFFLVTAQIELDFAPIMQTILKCVYFINQDNHAQVLSLLPSLPEKIRQVEHSFRLMHERLSGSDFYNKLRPFLDGYHEVGRVHEGVSDEPLKFYGGSAAQSSGFQVLDMFLGIGHSPEKVKFLKVMRDYMPGAHRQFLYDFQALPFNMKTYVKSKNCVELEETYNQCVETLVKFRSTHLAMVVKYITIQSNSQRNQYDQLKTRGTGGQDLLPFLRDLRHTTSLSKLPH